MSLLRAAAGALAGGLIGAAVWAAIAYFAHLEVGLIAWGIGAMAGVGAKVAAADELTPATGVVAALVAVVSIAVGKYAVVHVTVNEAFSEANTSFVMTEELATSFVADSIVLELEQAGESVEWPADGPNEYPQAEADYPPEVWSKAEEQWRAMPAAERIAYEDARREEWQAGMAAFADSLRAEGFKSSFGLFDLLFLGLAIATAFKIGSGTAQVSET